MKYFPLFLLLLASFLLLLNGCSGQETTGSVSAEVSTLLVTVQAENGSLLSNVEVYVNGQFKGKTNQYGEGKGTREVVLKQDENVIIIEKEGYISSAPISVSPLKGSKQKVTVVLEKIKVDYLISVYDRDGPVSGARVYFSRLNSSLPAAVEVTSSAGEVTFADVEDGNYSIRIVREEYIPQEVQTEINQQEGETQLSVEVTPLPRVVVEVTTSQGVPLNDAEVLLYRNKDYNTPGAWPLETKFTTSAGIVIFKGVEYNEKYTIVVRRQNYLAQSNQLLLTPDNEQLRFEMVWDID